MNIVIYGIRQVTRIERLTMEKAVLSAISECGFTDRFRETVYLTMVPSDCRKLGSKEEEPFLEIRHEGYESTEAMELAKELGRSGFDVEIPQPLRFLPGGRQ